MMAHLADIPTPTPQQSAMLNALSHEYRHLFNDNILLQQMIIAGTVELETMPMPTPEQTVKLNNIDTQYQEIMNENMLLKDMILEVFSMGMQCADELSGLIDENSKLVRELYSSLGPAHRYAPLLAKTDKTTKAAKSAIPHEEQLMNEVAECLAGLHSRGLDVEACREAKDLSMSQRTCGSGPGMRALVQEACELDQIEFDVSKDVTELLEMIDPYPAGKDADLGGDFSATKATPYSPYDSYEKPDTHDEPRQEEDSPNPMGDDEVSVDDELLAYAREFTASLPEQPDELLAFARELAASLPERPRRRHNINGSTRRRRRKERARNEAALAVLAGEALNE